MKAGGTFYLSNMLHFFSGKNINFSVDRPGFKTQLHHFPPGKFRGDSLISLSLSFPRG